MFLHVVSGLTFTNSIDSLDIFGKNDKIKIGFVTNPNPFAGIYIHISDIGCIVQVIIEYNSHRIGFRTYDFNNWTPWKIIFQG